MDSCWDHWLETMLEMWLELVMEILLDYLLVQLMVHELDLWLVILLDPMLEILWEAHIIGVCHSCIYLNLVAIVGHLVQILVISALHRMCDSVIGYRFVSYQD